MKKKKSECIGSQRKAVILKRSKYIQKGQMGGGIMPLAPLLIHRVTGLGGGPNDRDSGVMASVNRILRHLLPERCGHKNIRRFRRCQDSQVSLGPPRSGACVRNRKPCSRSVIASAKVIIEINASLLETPGTLSMGPPTWAVTPGLDGRRGPWERGRRASRVA